MVRLSTVFCNLLSLIKYYLEKIIAGRDGGREGEGGVTLLLDQRRDFPLH